MDREKILKNLLSKTVERGCSKAEAENAKQMAEKKATEWGIDLKAMERSLFLDGLSRRERMKLNVEDTLRNSRCYTEPVKTQKKKAEPKHGCTNPFGVHGKGYDPTGKWSSVAEFVMWHLRNTTLSFDEIALQSRMKFSGKTSKNSVAWYANKLKKQGVTIPERSK